jgi:hypothetical protein
VTAGTRPRAWLRRLDTWQKRTLASASAVGTIASAVLGGQAVYDHFRPHGPTACRGQVRGTLSDVRVDQRVSYAAYLQLKGADPGSASRERLRALGRVVHFDVAVDNLKGQVLPIYWWVLTAGGEPVAEPGLRRQLGMDLVANACSVRGVRDIWVELPERSGRFKIDIQLLDQANGQLDDLRTSSFVVRV